jgi:hypothetical protein
MLIHAQVGWHAAGLERRQAGGAIFKDKSALTELCIAIFVGVTS